MPHFAAASLLFALSLPRQNAEAPVPDAWLDAHVPRLAQLYRELHAAPEISYFEEKTAARIAGELKAAGFETAEKLGKYKDPSRAGHGVVGVLRNGDGPTILVRTDLDALPVEEKTGLPYASAAKTKDDSGREVSVMHACGHDMHMAVFAGTALALAEQKKRWKGTLVFVGQPAEERAPGGAEALLNDGLYTKFPKPDACLALHCNSIIPAGSLGYVEGFALANVDSVDITVRGKGGHGAYPHATKDPIVIAAEVVTALQTIVSREVEPGDPAVVTVGSIHGGTKHNIIPDDVKLELTVRSYAAETRTKILNAIERITNGIAKAAGVPEDRMPIVDLHPELLVPATYNNPALTQRCRGVLERTFGAERVSAMKPVMGGEDFGHYSLPDHSLPCFMMWLGVVDPAKVAEAKAQGVPLPSLHSSRFAPLPEPSIRTGVAAMTACVLDLLSKK